MGLGLLVGVASLGVISFRAVVERRQSIGMMRAIGFKGRMIQLQFLMESAIVAILGSLLGIGLGSLIAWNIYDTIGSDGVTFSIPWSNVIIVITIAFIFSLASRTQTSELLAFFYPQKESLGLGLLASLPVFLALVLVSQRERLWKKGYLNWRRWVIPLAQIGVVLLLCVQLYYAMHHHWGFEYITGVKMAFYSICLLYTSPSPRDRG